MSTGYSSNFKNCSTCDYWAGSRDIDSSRSKSMVASASEKGKCVSKDSPWKMGIKSASQNCPKWKKWGAFR